MRTYKFSKKDNEYLIHFKNFLGGWTKVRSFNCLTDLIMFILLPSYYKQDMLNNTNNVWEFAKPQIINNKHTYMEFKTIFDILRFCNEEILATADNSFLLNEDNNTYLRDDMSYVVAKEMFRDVLPAWTKEGIKNLKNVTQKFVEKENNKIRIGKKIFEDDNEYLVWRNIHPKYKILNYQHYFNNNVTVTYEYTYNDGKGDNDYSYYTDLMKLIESIEDMQTQHPNDYEICTQLST